MPPEARTPLIVPALMTIVAGWNGNVVMTMGRIHRPDVRTALEVTYVRFASWVPVSVNVKPDNVLSGILTESNICMHKLKAWFW